MICYKNFNLLNYIQKELLYMGHIFSKEILKANDIRGIYSDELDDLDGYHIGAAFATILSEMGKKTCIVGYDGRLSSLSFSNSIIKGLTEHSIDVTHIGLISTPVLYFAIHHLHKESGIMITASHNPKEYNGAKFVFSDRLFQSHYIEQLGIISEQGAYKKTTIEGNVEKKDVIEDYLSYITSCKKEEKRPIHVVFDTGSGSSGNIIKKFIQGKKHYTLICGEVDGTFPHHHPDPSKKENMVMLQQKVLELKADVGIAFDGDGDRIGLVDNTGRILTGDETLTILAKDFLSTHPKETVMSEVKISSIFCSEVKRVGGTPFIWKVGHAFQKEKMKQEGIKFAGESSGHIFYEENRGYDDALFAAVKVINMLTSNTMSLHDMVNSLPPIFGSGEIRLALPTKERYTLIAHIKKELIKNNRTFNDLDGVRVEIIDGFWILRSSNTQPHITIYCESLSEEGLIMCIKEMKHYIRQAGYDYDEIKVN